MDICNLFHTIQWYILSPKDLMDICNTYMYFPFPISQNWMMGKKNRKTVYLMVKTMVSCRFSLEPIHWLFHQPSTNLHQGAQILTAVLHELRPLLRQARLVVLGGCSAGGRGAFYNLEPWPGAGGGWWVVGGGWGLGRPWVVPKCACAIEKYPSGSVWCEFFLFGNGPFFGSLPCRVDLSVFEGLISRGSHGATMTC